MTRDITATGEDYGFTAGSVIFEGSSATAEARIPIKDDQTEEGPETFKIVLLSPTAATITEPTEAVVVILDTSDMAGMLEAGHVYYLSWVDTVLTFGVWGWKFRAHHQCFNAVFLSVMEWLTFYGKTCRLS